MPGLTKRVDAARQGPGAAELRLRRLGRAVSAVEARRGEILSLAYGLGGLGVIFAWAADPGGVTNAVAIGVPAGLALAGSVAAFVLRRHLPRRTEDAAIVASLALISLAMAFLADPALLSPYYVWVGFASPLWFPTRRSVAYLCLTGVACGADAAVIGTRRGIAMWCLTMATVVLAFVAVHFLSRMLVRHERLAAVGEMASAVGHELRNPLSAVTNALFLVRAAVGEPVPPEIERQLQLAERETGRAVDITADLMSFVRHRTSAAEPVDLEGVARDVLDVVSCPEGVSVELDLAPFVVTGDRGQLTEVLTNLVENAFDAMPGGGRLEVSATEEHGRVELTVADTGIGMDEATSRRVFEPFFTTRARGTGLGLAIVQRLVEDMGGTVALESAPGVGTRLTVRLPRSASRPAH